MKMLPSQYFHQDEVPIRNIPPLYPFASLDMYQQYGNSPNNLSLGLIPSYPPRRHNIPLDDLLIMSPPPNINYGVYPQDQRYSDLGKRKRLPSGDFSVVPHKRPRFIRDSRDSESGFSSDTTTEHDSRHTRTEGYSSILNFERSPGSHLSLSSNNLDTVEDISTNIYPINLSAHRITSEVRTYHGTTLPPIAGSPYDYSRGYAYFNRPIYRAQDKPLNLTKEENSYTQSIAAHPYRNHEYSNVSPANTANSDNFNNDFYSCENSVGDLAYFHPVHTPKLNQTSLSTSSLKNPLYNEERTITKILNPLKENHTSVIVSNDKCLEKRCMVSANDFESVHHVIDTTQPVTQETTQEVQIPLAETSDELDHQCLQDFFHNWNDDSPQSVSLTVVVNDEIMESSRTNVTPELIRMNSHETCPIIEEQIQEVCPHVEGNITLIAPNEEENGDCEATIIQAICAIAGTNTFALQQCEAKTSPTIGGQCQNVQEFSSTLNENLIVDAPNEDNANIHCEETVVQVPFTNVGTENLTIQQCEVETEPVLGDQTKNLPELSSNLEENLETKNNERRDCDETFSQASCATAGTEILTTQQCEIELEPITEEQIQNLQDVGPNLVENLCIETPNRKVTSNWYETLIQASSTISDAENLEIQQCEVGSEPITGDLQEFSSNVEENSSNEKLNKERKSICDEISIQASCTNTPTESRTIQRCEIQTELSIGNEAENLQEFSSNLEDNLIAEVLDKESRSIWYDTLIEASTIADPKNLAQQQHQVELEPIIVDQSQNLHEFDSNIEENLSVETPNEECENFCDKTVVKSCTKIAVPENLAVQQCEVESETIPTDQILNLQNVNSSMTDSNTAVTQNVENNRQQCRDENCHTKCDNFIGFDSNWKENASAKTTNEDIKKIWYETLIQASCTVFDPESLAMPQCEVESGPLIGEQSQILQELIPHVDENVIVETQNKEELKDCNKTCTTTSPETFTMQQCEAQSEPVIGDQIQNLSQFSSKLEENLTAEAPKEQDKKVWYETLIEASCTIADPENAAIVESDPIIGYQNLHEFNLNEEENAKFVEPNEENGDSCAETHVQDCSSISSSENLKMQLCDVASDPVIGYQSQNVHEFNSNQEENVEFEAPNYESDNSCNETNMNDSSSISVSENLTMQQGEVEPEPIIGYQNPQEFNSNEEENVKLVAPNEKNDYCNETLMQACSSNDGTENLTMQQSEVESVGDQSQNLQVNGEENVKFGEPNKKNEDSCSETLMEDSSSIARTKNLTTEQSEVESEPIIGYQSQNLRDWDSAMSDTTNPETPKEDNETETLLLKSKPLSQNNIEFSSVDNTIDEQNIAENNLNEYVPNGAQFENKVDVAVHTELTEVTCTESVNTCNQSGYSCSVTLENEIVDIQTNLEKHETETTLTEIGSSLAQNCSDIPIVSKYSDNINQKMVLPSMPLLGDERELPPIFEEEEEDNQELKEEISVIVSKFVALSEDSLSCDQPEDKLCELDSKLSDNESYQENVPCMLDKILKPTLPRNSTLSYSRFYGSEADLLESFLSRPSVSPQSGFPILTPFSTKPSKIQLKRRYSDSVVDSESDTCVTGRILRSSARFSSSPTPSQETIMSSKRGRSESPVTYRPDRRFSNDEHGCADNIRHGCGKLGLMRERSESPLSRSRSRTPLRSLSPAVHGVNQSGHRNSTKRGRSSSPAAPGRGTPIRTYIPVKNPRRRGRKPKGTAAAATKLWPTFLKLETLHDDAEDSGPEELLLKKEREKMLQYDSWLEQRRVLYSALLPDVPLKGSANMQPIVLLERNRYIDNMARKLLSSTTSMLVTQGRQVVSEVESVIGTL